MATPVGGVPITRPPMTGGEQHRGVEDGVGVQHVVERVDVTVEHVHPPGQAGRHGRGRVDGGRRGGGGAGGLPGVALCALSDGGSGGGDIAIALAVAICRGIGCGLTGTVVRERIR